MFLFVNRCFLLNSVESVDDCVGFFLLQTDERIFLVLEYCDGGDLAAYIQRHGRVSEALARHFMRQLGIVVYLLIFAFGCEFIMD